ncbi:hypothetical protein CBM2595_A40044 [Cupriavidus taiwanensis]|nr:hypothetical protein CBM2595_A40044 [Cupriavidus taiwanensis]
MPCRLSGRAPATVRLPPLPATFSRYMARREGAERGPPGLSRPSRLVAYRCQCFAMCRNLRPRIPPPPLSPPSS